MFEIELYGVLPWWKKTIDVISNQQPKNLLKAIISNSSFPNIIFPESCIKPPGMGMISGIDYDEDPEWE